MEDQSQNEELAKSLGRYSLVHALGQGGMGEVYLAKITGAAGFEKPCIVKTILPALLSDRQFLDRFHHEAKVLVHLVHSNIAQVYDMGEEAGSYFMALEYVAGVDLSQLLEEVRRQGTQIPIPIALYIGARIAEGLGYAHRKTAPDGTPLGIVHRDISPHNVMVGYEGEVKVIDFGLARSAARSKFTLPATVMGKLGYMSPEQARAEALDHRTDIYACGLVVWELLSGRSAFNAGTVGEMMAAMANPRVPALREVRSDIDPALEAAVAQAIAPDPAQRYTRADEFARKLSEQLIKLGASVGAEEVGQYVRTVCPEAFAAQRKLISKLSTVSTIKRTPIPLRDMSPPPVPSVAASTHDSGAFGATHVASSVSKKTVSLAGQSLTGAEVAALRPSRAPWIVAGAAIALLVAGGGFFAWRSMQSSSAASAPAAGAQPVAATGTGTPSATAPAGAVTTTTPAVTGATGTTPQTVTTSAGSPGGTTQTAPGSTAPVAAAAPAGVPTTSPASAATAGSPGETAPVAPPPAAAAPAIAASATSEKSSDASVAHKPAAAAEYIKPVKVGSMIVDRTGMFVRAGSADGLSEGSVLKVVGRPEKNGKRKVIGLATVLDVKPKLSRIALDDSAKKAKGGRFIALPNGPSAPAPNVEAAAPSAPPQTVPAVAAAPAPASPPPATVTPAAAQTTTPAPAAGVPAVGAPRPTQKHLSGRVTVSGALMKSLVLHNADSTAWTDCTIFIRDEGKYPAKYPAGAPIAAGSEREVPLGKFRRDPTARIVAPNMVGITCAEGSVDLPAKY